MIHIPFSGVEHFALSCVFHFDEALAQFHNLKSLTSVNGVSVLAPPVLAAVNVVLEVSELNRRVLYGSLRRVRESLSNASLDASRQDRLLLWHNCLSAVVAFERFEAMFPMEYRLDCPVPVNPPAAP